MPSTTDFVLDIFWRIAPFTRKKINKNGRTPSNIKLFVVRHGIFFKPISKLYQTNQGSSPLRILHLRQTCLTYFSIQL